MTHKFETPDDYIELKELFDKLKSLADKMGVDVDDIMDENNHQQMHTTFRQKTIFSTKKRKRYFSKFDTGRVPFTVFKNSNV